MQPMVRGCLIDLFIQTVLSLPGPPTSEDSSLLIGVYNKWACIFPLCWQNYSKFLFIPVNVSGCDQCLLPAPLRLNGAIFRVWCYTCGKGLRELCPSSRQTNDRFSISWQCWCEATFESWQRTSSEMTYFGTSLPLLVFSMAQWSFAVLKMVSFSYRLVSI